MVKERGVGIAVGFAFEVLPVVKVDRVAQAKTGHEIIPVQGNSFFQCAQLELLRSLRHYLLESPDVTGHPLIDAQLDVLSVCLNPVGNRRLVQRRERAAQGRARFALIQVGPQEQGEGITAVTVARHGKVGEQGNGFARVDLNRLVVHADLRCAQQGDGEMGHGLDSKEQQAAMRSGICRIVVHERVLRNGIVIDGSSVTVFVTIGRRSLGRVAYRHIDDTIVTKSG